MKRCFLFFLILFLLIPLNTVFALDVEHEVTFNASDFTDEFDGKGIRFFMYLPNPERYEGRVNVDILQNTGDFQVLVNQGVNAWGYYRVYISSPSGQKLRDNTLRIKLTIPHEMKLEVTRATVEINTHSTYVQTVEDYSGSTLDYFFVEKNLTEVVLEKVNLMEIIRMNLRDGGILYLALGILGIWLAVGLVKRLVYWFARSS